MSASLRKGKIILWSPKQWTRMMFAYCRLTAAMLRISSTCKVLGISAAKWRITLVPRDPTVFRIRPLPFLDAPLHSIHVLKGFFAATAMSGEQSRRPRTASAIELGSVIELSWSMVITIVRIWSLASNGMNSKNVVRCCTLKRFANRESAGLAGRLRKTVLIASKVGMKMVQSVERSHIK